MAIDLARAVETALLGDVDPADDTPEAAAVVQENVDVIAAQSTARLRQRTQRILRALDPVAAGKAANRRRRDRIGVFSHPDEEPGLTHLHAILDSAVAAKLMAVIDQLARDLHADTTTDKTLSECRADALADLILGNATVTTKLVIQVPIHTGSEASGTDSGSDSASGGDSATAGGGDTAATAARAGSAFWPAAASSPAAGTSCPGGGCWPPAFARPITGLTVYPHGRRSAAAGATGTAAGAGALLTATGVRIKSQHEMDAQFNELLKTLFPPDPADYPPEEFDEYYEPTQRDGLDDGPPAWLRPEPPAPDRQPGSPGSSGPSGSSARSHTSAACLGDGLVPGVGVIPAAVIQEMCRSFGTVITRALIDADTGVTLETNETQYKPSPRLAHFIRTRDVHCRFPGVRREALVDRVEVRDLHRCPVAAGRS